SLRNSLHDIIYHDTNFDEYITKFWESVRTEMRKEQVRRFIQFTNLMFEVVKLKDEKLQIKINLLLVGVVVHLSLRAILFAQRGVVFRFLPDSGSLAEDKQSSLFRMPSTNFNVLLTFLTILFQQEMMVPSHFERLSKQQYFIFENYA
ncbi:8790_t:CDS:2, partial [Funneliformis geosporum]